MAKQKRIATEDELVECLGFVLFGGSSKEWMKAPLLQRLTVRGAARTMLTAARDMGVLLLLPSQRPQADDPDDMEDFLTEAIADSIDMDWQPSWGAQSILRQLKEQGVRFCPIESLPHPVTLAEPRDGQLIGLRDSNGNELRCGDTVRYRLEGSHTKEEYWNPEYRIIYDAPSFTLEHIGGGKDGGSRDFKLKHGGGNGDLELIKAYKEGEGE